VPPTRQRAARGEAFRTARRSLPRPPRGLRRLPSPASRSPRIGQISGPSAFQRAGALVPDVLASAAGRGAIDTLSERTLRSTATVKRAALTIALVLALVLPATASARVRLVHITSPVSAGSHATLRVAVSPSRTCSITVYYKSGRSHAAGLYPKRPSGGRVSWTWKVGTRTTPGRWPIVVSCGSAGSLRTSFRVT
jgi:hypothetical protein